MIVRKNSAKVMPEFFEENLRDMTAQGETEVIRAPLLKTIFGFLRRTVVCSKKREVSRGKERGRINGPEIRSIK